MRKWILSVALSGIVIAFVGYAFASQLPTNQTASVGQACSDSDTHEDGLGAWDAPFASLQDLLDGTEAIVEVTVLSAKPQYDAKDRTVYTISDVEVEKSILGPLQVGDTVPMRIRGGRDGDKATLPDPMMPILEPNTRHLLLLKQWTIEHRPELNGWYLSAGFQSRAEVARDGAVHPIATKLKNPLSEWKGKPVSELRKAIEEHAPKR